MMPEKEKEFDYPPRLYRFTGEYHHGTAGHRKAHRNKDRFRAPIYKSDDGKTVVDMTQIEYTN
jgi:hypothetical protein